MSSYISPVYRPSIPRLIPVTSESIGVEFVDDASIASKINLKKSLVPDPYSRSRPLQFHERTQHVLPAENNYLQYRMHEAEKFFEENKMIINKTKTKCMLFNRSRNYEFPPELEFIDGTLQEVVSGIKLVGIKISDNLSWSENTDYICQKSRKRLWTLRRMKRLGFDPFTIFETYAKEIRSLLEYAAPVWHSSITKKQSAKIEAIQKHAFRLILSDRYQNYNHACTHFGVATLAQRRETICLRFARKNLNSPNSFFERIIPARVTRQKPNLVKEYKCRTKRFHRSPLPFLARLLNQNN